MTQHDRTDKALKLLRDLPAEVSIEEVGAMITLFPQLQPSTSWYKNINLNSILMTTAGAFIIASIAYVLALDKAPLAQTIQPKHVVEDVGSLIQEPILPVSDPVFQVELPPEPDPLKAIQQEKPTVNTVGTENVLVVEAPETVQYVAPLPVTTHDLPNGPSAPLERALPMRKNEHWDFTGFHTVKVLGPINVMIEQGPFSVSSEGDTDEVGQIEISLKGKELVVAGRCNGPIKKTKDCKCTYDGSITVRVSMPDLERVELLGPSDVHIAEFRNLEKLALDLKGSGEIHFSKFVGLKKLAIALAGSGDIHGEEVDVSGATVIALAGSGDVILAGTTGEVQISVVGSGDVDASELTAGSGSAQIMGSGEISVNSKRALTQQITGSGEIHEHRSGGSDH